MERNFGIPFTRTVPIGVGATHSFLVEVHTLLGLKYRRPMRTVNAHGYPGTPNQWIRLISPGNAYSFSVMAAIAAARICQEELGFEVVGLGTYSREMARAVRAAANNWAWKP